MNLFIIVLTVFIKFQSKKIMSELSDFHILKDNKMNVVKDGIIPGNKIVVFKVKHHKIVNAIPFHTRSAKTTAILKIF